jgi:hypothetical protein
MVTINNKLYNLDAIVRVYDREVFFADGKSEVMTEPEIQELFKYMFGETHIPACPEPITLKKPVVKKAKK